MIEYTVKFELTMLGLKADVRIDPEHVQLSVEESGPHCQDHFLGAIRLWIGGSDSKILFGN